MAGPTVAVFSMLTAPPHIAQLRSLMHTGPYTLSVRSIQLFKRVKSLRGKRCSSLPHFHSPSLLFSGRALQGRHDECKPCSLLCHALFLPFHFQTLRLPVSSPVCFVFPVCDGCLMSLWHAHLLHMTEIRHLHMCVFLLCKTPLTLSLCKEKIFNSDIVHIPF